MDIVRKNIDRPYVRDYLEGVIEGLFTSLDNDNLHGQWKDIALDIQKTGLSRGNNPLSHLIPR